MGTGGQSFEFGQQFPQSGVKLAMPSSEKRCASEGKEAELGPTDRAQRLCRILPLPVVHQELRNARKGSASQRVVDSRTGFQWMTMYNEPCKKYC